MENPWIDRQDADNSAAAEFTERWGRFLSDKYNAEVAKALVESWSELKSLYCGWFGDDADLSDEISMDDVKSAFKIEKGKS